MSAQDLLKKLEVSKSQQPKGQLILKHLSPQHNPKAGKDGDLRLYNQVMRLFTEFRSILDTEMHRVYVREEVKEVQPNQKLPGRVIMKVEANFVDVKEVPFEFLTAEDRIVFLHRETANHKDFEVFAEQRKRRKTIMIRAEDMQGLSFKENQERIVKAIQNSKKSLETTAQRVRQAHGKNL
ncbi:hypothetical protein FGO68_gene4172 [Halteria grandinella]|uniref:Uncharacterized protein n=1 Tax=Halteria grandinella TaxID=5974 RepID=A0A8J8SV14_HALGN|nr:hypothetical protein FGO68_gene4172 [Halteria grandinella]